MLISYKYLIKNSTIKRSQNYCSCSTDSSLASILFPEPEPVEKALSSKPPTKFKIRNQAKNVVSSATDVAANVLGVSWDDYMFSIDVRGN